MRHLRRRGLDVAERAAAPVAGEALTSCYDSVAGPALLQRGVRFPSADPVPKAIEAGWREWIVEQPSWMQDMLTHSVMTYVRQRAGDQQPPD